MNPVRHRSEVELLAGLPALRESPKDDGTLVTPGPELRELPGECELSTDAGIPGDRWSRSCSRRLEDGRLNPDSQITLMMNSRVLALVAGPRHRCPLAGDNLLVELDLSEENLPAGRRLRIGASVIEITSLPHTGCAKFSKRFGPEALKFVNSPEGRGLRLRGVHARLIQPGRIRVGERIIKE